MDENISNHISNNFPSNFEENTVIRIMQTIEELNSLQDVDTILDRTLFEARRFVNADAGSIFLEKDSMLTFSYVHNDTLFKDESNVALYNNFQVPIDEKSIVGYCALTGKSINIDDAYSIPLEFPYKFNKEYDHKSGYRTQSILAIPLRSFNNKLVGVMQLINAKDENKQWIAFSEVNRIYVSLFASHAAVAIERAMMNREMFLRMVKIAELHDPLETGMHVQRVSTFSGEIYQRWATNRGYDKKSVKKTKDLLRIAAMLHDVGKVGISDLIIKKPGKLTDQEYDIMKWHTVYGARLFASQVSELDRMCYDISLNHHEKWAGNGYPGLIPDIMSDEVKMGVSKKGEEIPISARVTAIADVYDALSSRRSYKDPWPEEKIVAIIKEESGKHFDPELVTAFLDIHNVLMAIREKYK